MAYKIFYSRAAAKAFGRIHPVQARRLRDAIEALAKNPRPDGAVVLAGGCGELRIRVEDFRVVYEIQDDQVIVLCRSLSGASSLPGSKVRAP